MKSFIVALCIVGCVLAEDKDALVVRNDFEQSPVSFSYAYETNNGISGQAEGLLKSFDKETAAVVVTGSNQYKDKDGVVYALSYTADENGYHPVGDHLPTPPAPVPIPDYIVRQLAYIKEHSPKQ